MLDASNPAVSQTDTAIAQSAIEPASLVIAIADCSDYTASAIFDDPTGDWDQDGQSNVSEFYQQLDPCTAQVAQAVDSPDDAGSTLGSLAVEAVDYEGAADADAPVDSTVVDDGVSPEAQAVATVTCPAYSVQDIFSDPSGDWDGDGISNIIEFDNLLDPCTYDGNVPSTLESASIPSTVNTDSENVCPAFSVADVQADPNGDWDNDGASNLDEFYNRFDPCEYDADATQSAGVGAAPIGADTTPCPTYGVQDVFADPGGDWDQDRISNLAEFNSQLDPCAFDIPEPTPTPTPTTATATVPTPTPAGSSDDDQPASGPAIDDAWLGTFSQLVVTDLIEGSGDQAVVGSSLSVQYVGVLASDGTEFDSSWSRGAQPFNFTLGQGAVITGWDEGLIGMRVGGRRLLQIPAAKAYGSQSQGSVIGPNL